MRVCQLAVKHSRMLWSSSRSREEGLGQQLFRARRCRGGFCHCKPGYYGADCALSSGIQGQPVLLAGQGYVPRQRGVKIFVYELPPELHVYHSISGTDTPLAQMLAQRLLSSGARVAQGTAADYFFIPLVSGSRQHLLDHLPGTIAFVRKHWPFWDHWHGGHRHLLVLTGEGHRALQPWWRATCVVSATRRAGQVAPACLRRCRPRGAGHAHAGARAAAVKRHAAYTLGQA